MSNFSKFNTSIVNLVNQNPSLLYSRSALDCAITNCYVQFEAIYNGSKKDKAEMRMYLQGLLDGAMLHVIHDSLDPARCGPLSVALRDFKEILVEHALQKSYTACDTSKFRS